jgi:TRAP-type C4-dicarboxylate transport system substrate-binding protein
MTTHVARLSGLIATTLLLAIGWSPVYGADIKERTIKLPVVTAIDHPLGIGTLKFKELIEQKSDGKIKARVFPNGTLGGEVQIISSLQGGTIEASIVLPANLAGLSGSFAALDFPYVFDSERHAAAVLDGPVGARLAEALPEKGLIGLGFMESGFRHYTNSKHPITKVEDMSGLKMRSLQSSIFIDFANALGANAVPLSFTELYSALETVRRILMPRSRTVSSMKCRSISVKPGMSMRRRSFLLAASYGTSSQLTKRISSQKLPGRRLTTSVKPRVSPTVGRAMF